MAKVKHIKKVWPTELDERSKWRNKSRKGLRAGMLPRSVKHVEKNSQQFRRALEDAVEAVKGEITITDAARINSATRWETHAGLAHHWLKKEMDNMTLEQRMHFSREVANASSNRDKCIAALKLNEKIKENLDLQNYVLEAEVKE